ncbi:hypothetical protein FRT59_17485 [Pseudomonas haemolytica]|uniref:Uncharacterized protein n=1 Tax=Pseudomonas haemolytica TaxID=2600065 RepID=A0A5P1DE13_9PSED|nr:hypothetical protein [Pseudomonas haemolytica]
MAGGLPGGRAVAGGRVSAYLLLDRVAPIGGKPPLTGECIPNVGGGLPPMRPSAPPRQQP